MPSEFRKLHTESTKKAEILKLEAKQAQLKRRIKHLKSKIGNLEIEIQILKSQFEETQQQD